MNCRPVRIPGNYLGEAAKIATDRPAFGIKHEPELLIGYPHLLVQVSLADFKGSKAQRIGYLRKVAEQMPARLP